MVDLQKNFITFHDKIKLEYEDNSLLRDYKDQVLDGLKKILTSTISFLPLYRVVTLYLLVLRVLMLI